MSILTETNTSFLFQDGRETGQTQSSMAQIAETDSSTSWHGINEPHHEKKLFAYAKTKAQISCAVTAQLISTFVFTT